MKKKLFSLLLSLALITALTGSALGAGEEPVGVLEKAPKSYLTQEPYLTQCELGCVAADALRQAAGTQVALVNFGDIQNDLNQGEVTQADMERVFTADQPLAVAEVTGEQLYQILEHAVSQIQVDPNTEQVVEGSEEFDGFCQVSGFTFRYDASAPVGERVVSVTLEDGTKVARESQSTLTLAATEGMLSGGYGFPEVEHQTLDEGLVSALASYVSGHTDLPEGETSRISIIGARQNAIIEMFPRGALVGVLVLCMVFLAMTGLRAKRYQDER